MIGCRPFKFRNWAIESQFHPSLSVGCTSCLYDHVCFRMITIVRVWSECQSDDYPLCCALPSDEVKSISVSPLSTDRFDELSCALASVHSQGFPIQYSSVLVLIIFWWHCHRILIGICVWKSDSVRRLRYGGFWWRTPFVTNSWVWCISSRLHPLSDEPVGSQILNFHWWQSRVTDIRIMKHHICCATFLFTHLHCICGNQAIITVEAISIFRIRALYSQSNKMNVPPAEIEWIIRMQYGVYHSWV